MYPGIINEADQGVLYLDDANLLREDLLDSILNIAEVGAYQLERDGLSLRCDTSFTVIAAINPESGMLSGACLDQFGLFVNVDNIHDENTRVEILKRTILSKRIVRLFVIYGNWKMKNKEGNTFCNVLAAQSGCFIGHDTVGIGICFKSTCIRTSGGYLFN